jgi:hypothetical protein
VQLAARQRGLQQVARIHRAFGLARADQRVHLVDEQDDLALGALHFVEHGLEALLELAAIFGAGDQRAHVERHQAAILELSGTSPLAMRSARPSTIAVLPTPGSPISAGLFLVRRARIWTVRRISSSRPITGSSLPSRAPRSGRGHISSSRHRRFPRPRCRRAPAAQRGDRRFQRLRAYVGSLQRLPGSRRAASVSASSMRSTVTSCRRSCGDLFGLVEQAHGIVVEPRRSLRARARDRRDLAQRLVHLRERLAGLPPARWISPLAMPSVFQQGLENVFGVMRWWLRRIASVCAACRKPLARSVNFSRFMDLALLTAKVVLLLSNTRIMSKQATKKFATGCTLNQFPRSSADTGGLPMDKTSESNHARNVLLKQRPLSTSMSASILALSLAGCSGHGALPQHLATTAPEPAPAPLADLVKSVNIPYEQFTLPNGLRVLVHTDRKAPVVALSVWYAVGSKNEPKGKTGFAHLFEHLMFNGSEHNKGDFFTPLQNAGATDYNGTTWFDRTNYFETVPTAALDRFLMLESDRMGYLLGAVTQETLDNQRSVVQNEKRQGDNEPFGIVQYEQLENLYPVGHPYPTARSARWPTSTGRAWPT